MLNPADSVSRELLTSKILWNDLWFQEPSLLLLGDTANSEFSLRNLKLKEHVTLLNLKKDIRSHTYRKTYVSVTSKNSAVWIKF